MNKIMKNRLLFLLFFLLGMLFCGSLNAQTVRSTNITKISGKEYYMHHVKQGETLWGLSRLYNVSIEEIESLNPDVKNGLKAGHVLGIPVRLEKEPETLCLHAVGVRYMNVRPRTFCRRSRAGTSCS